MTFFLLKFSRLAISLLFILSLNFLIPRIMPGNPLFTILGPDVVGLSQKEYRELEEEYGLNATLLAQYREYLTKLLHWDLGYSYHHHRPVALLIIDHLTRTLLLLFPSVLISSLLAVIMGMVSGRFSGAAIDVLITLAFLAVYAMPTFLLAMVGLDLFSFRYNLFPLGGLKSPSCTGDLLSCPGDVLLHLVLPVAILSISSAAVKFMVTRNSVIEEKQQDYVLYARAKGISTRAIWLVHILKNASLPLLSLIALHLAFMVSGALLVEIVFSINGMGILIYEAAINRDYPVLQGCFLVLTVIVLGLNTLVDFIYGILDPRVRA
ncbi:ABC transporter permease [bacterium]|nr:ABC transporter permease [bacterium]